MRWFNAIPAVEIVALTDNAVRHIEKNNIENKFIQTCLRQSQANNEVG